MEISPRYICNLTKQIEEKLWNEFSSYANVLQYIKRWLVIYDDYGNSNFDIIFLDDKRTKINLPETLSNIDSDTILKIAIDLDIPTPDFIPCIPTFRNEIKSSYEVANSTLDKAFNLIYEDPSTSIGLANSALESIFKHILDDPRVKTKWNSNDTLYKLGCAVLKEFKLTGLDDNYSKEVKTLGSSLLTVCQCIEKLRSEKTLFHGKTETDIIINDPMYTFLIINSICTIGKFCISFYECNYPPITQDNYFTPDIPF